MNGSHMGDLTTLTTKSPNTMDRGSEKMTQTTGSANQKNENLNLEIIEDPTLYPWTEDPAEKRRCFVFEYFNFNPDIAIKPQTEAMEQINRWLLGK